VEDYGEWRCNGYAEIAVHVSAGDQRSYVSYGSNAKKEPAAKQTHALFNGEGEKIEWRAERGADNKLKPFATIVRSSTTVSSGDEPVRGEMLVVTRLAPGRVCHVGYVDAKASLNANLLAKKSPTSMRANSIAAWINRLCWENRGLASAALTANKVSKRQLCCQA